MKLNRKFAFFAFLIESYAQKKNKTAAEIIKILDEKNLTTYIYDMYELYHVESIENAYMDIDSLIATGKNAW